MNARYVRPAARSTQFATTLCAIRHNRAAAQAA
jgi:hypothetical protein